MRRFFNELNKDTKLKRDLIECAIGEIIIFLVAYLLKEAPIAWAGLFFLVVMIFGFIRRIKHELY